MNLNRLRAFVTVAQTGSFSQAAKLLGISQPGVSQQVKGLEADLGTPLLERTSEGVRLTPAGVVVQPRAEGIVREWDLLQAALRARTPTRAGRLRVGASTVPGTYYLPEIISRFRDRHPHVEIHMEIGSSTEIAEGVAAGRFDVGAVGTSRTDNDQLVFRPLVVDFLTLIASCRHPWVASGPIAPSELANAGFVSRQPGSGTRRTIEAGLPAWGITYDTLQVVAELGSTEAIIGAVEAGLGVSLVSRVAVQPAIRLGRICSVEVDAKPLSRHLFLVHRAGGQGAELVTAFCDMALYREPT